jgi:uncharacterized protein
VTRILVLAKEPAPGRSKTRLCPPLEPRQAAEVAEAALVTTLDAVAGAASPARTLVLDGVPGPWMRPGFRVAPQRGDGQAERLANAFVDAGGPALLIGMDSPQVTAALLDDAVAALRAPAVDAVLGPAEDGGYWAIGLNRPDPRVFAGVPMSRPDTGRRQLERLHRLGLRTRLLPVLRDVDHFDDAVAVARSAPGTRFADTVGRLARVQRVAAR